MTGSGRTDSERDVPIFRDRDGALAAISRLEAEAGSPLSSFFDRALTGNADPDRAVTNLERWLRATSSPGLHLQQMAGVPALGSLMLSLLGASQPIADALIQNPELASLILEPGEVRRVPDRAGMTREGQRLLSSATSYSHGLDRLRFIKQRYNLPLVLNDLSGSWEQETVWRVLSDLADALIGLARDLAWTETRKTRELPEENPVLIVGFGKLGGRELNYSSDVDLVYVVPDGTDERLERDITRYCEAFGRAVSDRMGRGSLYRVDLRLRPYGGSGPIVRSMRSYEAYYRLYAEPWEIQALLRSRPIAGPPALAERWEAMREEHCFRPRLSDIVMEQLLAMRTRIEEGATDADLKRGAGGIRDVEFLTQVLQMLHGHGLPSLRTLATCDALRRLEEEGILDHAVVSSLIEGYTFLRKLEHRMQLVGDRQTHDVPAEPAARESLARSMGLASWPDLESVLGDHRRTIGLLYRSTLHPEQEGGTDRSFVLRSLGASASAVAQWFDLLPESEAYYRVLRDNEGSLRRVTTLATRAPRLIEAFRHSLPITEMLLSGEIEEDIDLARRIDKLPLDADLRVVAETFAVAHATAAARWVLGATDLPNRSFCDLLDSLVRHCVARLGVSFDILALGSYGACEMGSASDLDLLLLVPTKDEHPQAEASAQALLNTLGSLRRYGAQIAVDLRLRPEGGKGLLVRTYDGIRNYELLDMEMWERFALGQARLVSGRPEAVELVRHAAYGLPLTPERLRELVRMKRRIESERVSPMHVRRNVKLGSGGLNDLEWLVHLHEMRYPTATHAGETTEMTGRILMLAQARLLNFVEVDALLNARTHLLRVRNALHLLGIEDDLIPENPDKLDRLARALDEADGHTFLRKHGTVIDAVRRLYEDSLERLRA